MEVGDVITASSGTFKVLRLAEQKRFGAQRVLYWENRGIVLTGKQRDEVETGQQKLFRRRTYRDANRADLADFGCLAPGVKATAKNIRAANKAQQDAESQFQKAKAKSAARVAKRRSRTATPDHPVAPDREGREVK